MTVPHKTQRGVLLIELIISMVIIGIALAGVLNVMNATVKRSADPVVLHQAVAIAESYLEEILAQSFDDPDGSDGEINRSLLDDVDDYHGLSDTGVYNQHGALVATLSNYNVSIAVSSSTLTGGVATKKVIVSVMSGEIDLNLVGYKMDI